MLASGFPQFPNILLADYVAPGGANIGTQTFSILRQGQDTHHLVGTMSLVHGLHEFKFGSEVRMHRINFAQPGWPAGEFNFDYNGSSQVRDVGGDPMAKLPDGSWEARHGCFEFCPYEVPNSVSTQNFQWGMFVQDNWRITPKLTLNLGLRYDVSLPRTEREDRKNRLDLTAVNPLNNGSITYDDPLTSDSVTRKLLGTEIFAGPKDRKNFGTDWKDFQPRFGFAYQMSHNFVMRGGYGIFFSTPRSGAAGTGPINTYKGYDQLTSGERLAAYQVTPFARLSDPFPGSGPLLPLGNTLGALNDVGFGGGGNLKSLTDTPYEQTWSLGFEKELPGKIILETTYVGKKGTHLYFSGASELNHLPISVESLTPSQISDLETPVANPFFGIITNPLSPLSEPEIQGFQLLLPYPQFTSLQVDTFPIASSSYHALQLRAEKSYANGLQFLATYTWSKSIDNASATDDSVSWLGGNSSLQDPNRPDLERSVSQFDIPHLLQFSYVYDLPFGRKRKFGSNMNPVVNAILGGWQVNGIIGFSSGRPIQLSLDSGIAIPTYGGRRPNLSGTLKRNTGPDFLNQYFSNASQVLSQPADFTIGNAPRALSNIRQPGTKNATMSLFKQFSLNNIREGMRLEYRLEAFNILNHPQFCGPDTSARFSDTGELEGNFGRLQAPVMIDEKYKWRSSFIFRSRGRD